MWPIVAFVVGVYTGNKCPYVSSPVVRHVENATKHLKATAAEGTSECVIV
jgi:hypothetical protein